MSQKRMWCNPFLLVTSTMPAKQTLVIPMKDWILVRHTLIQGRAMMGMVNIIMIKQEINPLRALKGLWLYSKDRMLLL